MKAKTTGMRPVEKSPCAFAPRRMSPRSYWVKKVGPQFPNEGVPVVLQILTRKEGTSNRTLPQFRAGPNWWLLPSPQSRHGNTNSTR